MVCRIVAQLRGFGLLSSHMLLWLNTVPTWNGTLMVCWRRSGNISVWHVFTQSRREWIQIMRTLLYCHPRGGLLRISATESTKIWSNNLNSMSHFLYSMILALDSSKLSVCQRICLVPGFLLGVDPAFPVSSPQKYNHQLHRPLGVGVCVWMHMIGKDNLGPRIRMCYISVMTCMFVFPLLSFTCTSTDSREHRRITFTSFL